MYPDTQLFIDGDWCDAADGRKIIVFNPASGEEIGCVAHCGTADLDRALAAAERGFAEWRRTSPLVRSDIMRRAATLLRDRSPAIARIMTAEQGKPVAEAMTELAASAEILDWGAEEARRSYGRIIPARVPGVLQLALKEPVGPVAAFSPWNFPVSQAVRKIAAALAAGCSMIIKPPEETPASPAALIRAFADAGVPGGVLNMVFGVPAEISEYLIASPVVRKVSFTGSTSVGKHLAALAGKHMKRATMELGGHAPSIVFDDADIERAASVLSGGKHRNAGQVCIAPTRFLIHDSVYDGFMAAYLSHVRAHKIGNGAEEGVTIGALANERRLNAVSDFVEDAVNAGAKLLEGGERIGNRGNFYAPTVLTNVPLNARAMSEEPFGPISLVTRFTDTAAVIAEANRLPYGLACYAFTASAERQQRLSDEIEAGMISINHFGLALAELPFGGVKESGYGSEGGSEAMEGYLTTKFVSRGS